jgi:hypothetical protein
MVRPFVTLNQCLEGVRFRLFSNTEFDDRTIFDAADAATRDVCPEFRLGVDTSTIRDLDGLAPKGALNNKLPNFNHLALGRI